MGRALLRALLRHMERFQQIVNEIIDTSTVLVKWDQKTKIEITKGAPPTYNNEKLFNAMMPELSKSFSGTFDLSPVKWMYAEDFSYYTEVVPCFYFGLGISKDKLGNENTHTNEFSIHSDALIFGIELFCDIAMLNK